MIRHTIQGDYAPFASPRKQLSRVSIAAEGVISRVYPASVDIGPEDQGLMLMDVQVTNMLKGGGNADRHRPLRLGRRTRRPRSRRWLRGSRPEPVCSSSATPARGLVRDAAPADAVVMETAAEGLIVETAAGSFEVAWGEQPTGRGWQGIDTMSELSNALTASPTKRAFSRSALQRIFGACDRGRLGRLRRRGTRKPERHPGPAGRRAAGLDGAAVAVATWRRWPGRGRSRASPATPRPGRSARRRRPVGLGDTGALVVDGEPPSVSRTTTVPSGGLHLAALSSRLVTARSRPSASPTTHHGSRSTSKDTP